MSLQEFLDRIVLDNSVRDWIRALGMAAVSALALGVLKRLIQARLAKWAEGTETDLDDLVVDLVRRIHRAFLVILGLWIGARFLELHDRAHAVLDVIVRLNFYLQAALWGVGLVDYGIKKLLIDKRAPDDPGRTMGSSILGLLGRIVVLSVVALLALQNVFGQNVSALLTGLGVGGIAVALALQNVLGDLFASITILLDKPFVIGDSITVGDFTGTVEQIGIKTTRLKSVNGEQIVMGNADLVNSRIRNFKRLEERRNQFNVGVTYQTTPEQLNAIPRILREVIEATPETRFDRAHFKSFGDSALLFEAAYFVLKPDYNSFMDAQQAVHLELFRRFAAEKIEFAYPTHTVFLAEADGTPLRPARDPRDQKELSRG